MGGFAWVTLATNDSYSLGALVLAHSLKRVNTAHQLAILITPGVTEAMRTQLSAVFNVVKEVDVLDSRDTANLALLARPELGITFTKLHCWRLTQYDKCVFLDADTLVLQNCDELFNREELSAAPDVGWPDCFNSGVFVYKPSDETFKAISDFALVHGTFDGGDQGLLNLYFSDWATKDIAKHLPFVYNVVSCVAYSYLPALKQFRDKLKIIHFIGATKPWLQPFDTETGLSRIASDSLAQSQSDFIQLWWNIFCTSVHPSLSANMNHHRLSYVLPSRASSSTNFLSSSTSDPSSFVPSSSLLYNHTVPDRSLPPLFTNDPDQGQNQGHYYFTDPWEVGSQDTGHNTQNLSNFNHNLQYSSGHHTENQQHNTNFQHEIQQQTHYDDRRDYHEAPHSYVSNNHHENHHQHHENHHQHHVNHHQNHDNNHHQNHDNHHQEHNNVQNYYLQMNRSRVDSFSQNSQQPINTITFHKEASSFHKEDNSLSSPSHHTKLSSSSSHSPSSPPSSSHLADAKQYGESVAETNSTVDDGNQEAGLAGALATVKLGSPLSEEQHALQDHLRRQGWEEGHVDYMGRDSFDNIWSKICETLSAGPSPAPASADLPAPPKPAAETQASAPKEVVRAEARRTSVPKAEKALETLFMKPNTMLQPTSEQADPLTPPPFLVQPQFTPAAPTESKTDDVKAAESAAAPLPPKAESESPALPCKPQPDSPAGPLPPKPQSTVPAQAAEPVVAPPAQAPATPPVEAPATPPAQAPATPPVQAPAAPPAQTPVTSTAQVPETPPAQTPAVPPAQTPAVPSAQTPAVPPPAQAPATPPAQAPATPPAQAPATPPVQAPTPTVPTPAAPPAQTPAVPSAQTPSVPPPEQVSAASPPAETQTPAPPVQASAPVESTPAAAPVVEPSSAKTPEAAPPAEVKLETVTASQPVLPETPPQSPPQQQETPVQPQPETPKTPVQPLPETPKTPGQPLPETPKTPVQSQPSTPTVTTATPPLSPPPVPSESPVSVTEKLSVQTDIPQTPPVVDAPPAAAVAAGTAPQVVPQASAAPSDEPPIPPKRKGGRGGGDQGKQGRGGGKGGRGKK